MVFSGCRSSDSDLLQRVGNGDIIVKPNVAELRGDRVEFNDGTGAPIDAIIHAIAAVISTMLPARQESTAVT